MAKANSDVYAIFRWRCTVDIIHNRHSKMTEKETLQGNKLIAEFLGFKRDISCKDFAIPYWYKKTKDGKCFFGYDSQLKYHESWNWLMPVVEKINLLAIDNYGEMNVIIAANECVIGEDYSNPIIKVVRDFDNPLIDMVYKACIQFIQWYNENKTPA